LSGHGIGRHRLRSNASDASSVEELDASFNSGLSPCASTTVFNYNTLRDQLNSPAKRNIATNKWCQDSAAVTASDNLFSDVMKVRSASASNIAPISNVDTPSEKNTVSRSQSIEVIVDKNVRDSEKSVFISAVNSKSCDQIDAPSFVDGTNNKKVNILTVSRSETERLCDGGQQKLCNGELTSQNEQKVERNIDDDFTNDPNFLSHDVSLSNSINIGLSDTSTVFENGCLDEEAPSILEDVAEEDQEMEPASLGSADGVTSSVAISLDDSFLDERRSTLDSKEEFDIDRSVTMDSVNSLASSDISNCDRSLDSESVSSRSVVNSQSDELICKNRSGSEILMLPPKSSSLSDKKNGISPYFTRRKKKEKKEKSKSKSRSLLDLRADSSSEPVLVSIKETGDGRRVLSETKCLYEELAPVVEKTMETTSVPIPVPVPVVLKKTPDNTPKRKRSLFFQNALKRFPVKRSSSEQNLFLPSPSTEMRPAMSAMNLVNGSVPNGTLDKHSPKNSNLDYEMGMRSLERKKNSSLRERLSALTSASSDTDLSKSGMDGKNSLRKDKKKLKGSTLKILSASPKEQVEQAPRRKTSMYEQGRPQFVTRKSVSVNRGPLKIMSIFKHWLAKHPKVCLQKNIVIKYVPEF